MTSLQVGEFVFGEENLRYLAESVRNSETLCEFYLFLLDKTDVQSFLRFLVSGIASNYTLIRLHASDSTEEETSEDQFIIQDVLVRNKGLVTSAAQLVVNNVRTNHCITAIERVQHSPGLIERVSALASADETEAVAMIQRSIPSGAWRLAGRR